MDGNTSRFADVVNSPEQKLGELYEQARSILLACPKQRKIIRDEDERFIATPKVAYVHEAASEDELSEDEKRIREFERRKQLRDAPQFCVAARVGKADYTGKEPLYLVVNDNFSHPVFSFEPGLDSVMNLVDVNVVADSKEIVTGILDEIAERNNELKNQRFDRIGAIVMVLGGGAVVMAVAGGLIWGVKKGRSELQQNHQENVARDEAQREAFDQENIDIETSSISPSETKFVVSQPSFFEQAIPRPTADETYSHPRLVDLDDTCTHITTINPSEENIRAVTDSVPEAITLSIDSTGNVEACLTSRASSSNKLAVQISTLSED